jgi:hypothetical protein
VEIEAYRSSSIKQEQQMTSVETTVPVTSPLSIDQMLESADIQYITVSVPEWGGEVRLGSITAGDMLNEIDQSKILGDRESTIRLIVRSIVGPDGERVPSADVEPFVQRFLKKDIRVINRLAEAALRLNGVGIKANELKNASGEATSDASPTNSQPPAVS